MESVPGNKNYELQQLFLQQKQAEIHAKLFEAGVIPRILDQHTGVGAKIASRGMDMLGVQCFPIRRKRLQPSGEEETVIQLCVKQPDITQQKTAAYKYISIGALDSSGVIIYPSKGIEQEDADAIIYAAMDLITMRENGELPDLDWSLQSIRNPNTSIQKL